MFKIKLKIWLIIISTVVLDISEKACMGCFWAWCISLVLFPSIGPIALQAMIVTGIIFIISWICSWFV